MAEPSGSNYPASLDNATSLLAAVVNQKSFTLSGAHNASVTTITTTATIAGITAPGYILIDSELAHFTGISGAQFTGATRGADGTTAASHSDGATIYHVANAKYHNQLRAAILAVETELGLNPSGAYADVVTRLDNLSGIPTNLIAYFNVASIPAGWAEFTAARGRFIMAVPLAGTVGGTVGAAMTNLEDRTHTHTGPSHSHNQNIGTAFGGWNNGTVSSSGSSGTTMQHELSSGGGGVNIVQTGVGTGGTGSTGTAATSNVVACIQQPAIVKS